ncbi:serine/threonine-protein kinase [Planomonospora algeriensis]
MIAGRYRLMRELGRGGMGVVWEGHDTLLDRPVAVKEVLLPPHLSPAEQERQLTRTSREARTAARLNHHGIVAVYDVAEEDGRPWIIMELVRARGLDEVGTLPVPQVAAIGRQVLSALHTAHRAGILHRDVKPSNVLLTPDGRAVLTDFGIATVEGDASLTQTGMVTGSPSFLPPERAVGTDAGPWSDLWSLGATLYAMLTDGRGPFERRDAMATLGALLTEEPDLGRVHPAMREVLAGLLQRDPAHRLTAGHADALLAAVSGEPSGAPGRTAESRTAPGRTVLDHPGHPGHAGQDRPAQGRPSHGHAAQGLSPQDRAPQSRTAQAHLAPEHTGRHGSGHGDRTVSGHGGGRTPSTARGRGGRVPVAVAVVLAVLLAGAAPPDGSCPEWGRPPPPGPIRACRRPCRRRRRRPGPRRPRSRPPPLPSPSGAAGRPRPKPARSSGGGTTRSGGPSGTRSAGNRSTSPRPGTPTGPAPAATRTCRWRCCAPSPGWNRSRRRCGRRSAGGATSPPRRPPRSRPGTAGRSTGGSAG